MTEFSIAVGITAGVIVIVLYFACRGLKTYDDRRKP